MLGQCRDRYIRHVTTNEVPNLYDAAACWRRGLSWWTPYVTLPGQTFLIGPN